MKVKFISFFFLTLFTISFVGCVGDDIDDLQNQIDDLNNKVDDLKESQDAALLAAIANMQSAIADLESSVNADYQRLLTDLTDLNDIVENNKNAIYYGNLLIDADYDAFEAQGAEIVTGKVIISKEEQVAKLAKLIMVGNNLQIEGGTTVTLPLLETVAGDLYITEADDADVAVELTKLASIGGGFGIGYNQGLASVEAPALVFVYEGLFVMDNMMLSVLSLPALDFVGELDIDGGFNMYETFDLSATDVAGEAYVNGLVGSFELALGVVGGNIHISDFEMVPSLSIANEVIVGEIYISGLRDLETISMPNLTKIEKEGWSGGNLTLQGIYPPGDGGGGGIGPMGLKSVMSEGLLAWTNNIVTIEGNLYVNGNNFSTVDAFNALETVGGEINFNGNGNIQSMLILEALTSVGRNITIQEKVKVFDGFNALESMNYNTTLTIAGKQTMNENWEMEGESLIQGFSSLTTANQINIDLTETTDFQALAALTSLTAYSWQTGITITMQNPNYEGVNGPVQLCEMQMFLENSVSEAYASEYWDHNWEAVDPMTAIPALTTNCGGGGIGIGM